MSEISKEAGLSKIRHDLRTPINHILGYSELLKEDLEDRGVKELGDLDKIRSAANTLLGLINTHLQEDTFKGALPSTRPQSPITDRPPHEADTQAETASITGHILVVDDNLENRETLRRRLEKQGHLVVEAADGAEALAAVAKENFDLVLLDVMMPIVGGYEALQKLKADPDQRHIPVIMISALDEIESVVRCIEAGADDYLPKPFNPTILRARIGAGLEKKKFRDQEQAYLEQIEATRARLEEELHEAERYVVSILPPPLDAPFPTRWKFIPSTELGGDSFGYHWLDDTHFAIYLLDVCGHGVGASLLSVAALNVVRSGALPNTDFHDPSQVLDGLNRTFEMERHNNMYFTMWYGVFDTQTRVMKYASGGHPPALLIHPDHPPKELRTPGMIIGAMPDIPYVSATTHVPDNAKLFVFSDGAYEIKRKADDMLSFEEFTEVVAREGFHDNAIERIFDFIKTLHGEGPLDDDFSMLTVNFPPTP